jgi:ferredoxin
MRKGEFHVKLPDSTEFAKMLVDLNNFVRPRLYIMDGIMAMEGNGPRGGTPRQMNVLLFSTDPVALDATASRLINLNPLYVPTTLIGGKTGSGTFKEEDIEIVGDKLSNFICMDFNVERKPVKTVTKNKMVSFLNDRLISKPCIISEKCTQCGTCVQSCPVEGKAVNWENGDHTKPPVYDYKKCIRCYCCQEMCPESAIILKDPIIIKVGKIF